MQKGDVGGAFSTYGLKNSYRILVENTEEYDLWGPRRLRKANIKMNSIETWV